MAHKPYLGELLKQTEEVPVEGGNEKLYPYFADDELKKAVNLALLLNRPLLVMGEPGCGKSLLAKAVAFEWYQKEMYTQGKYFEWNIKSTSKAREGLYEFDHLLRLRDANQSQRENRIVSSVENHYEPDGNNLQDNDRYRHYGPMAKAMEKSKPDQKAVLLIDEIDKADIDFSNDLLTELERNSFYIPETRETKSFPKENKPFIVITSNGEKDLSDAFLRRCVFHYIDLFSIRKIDTLETTNWLRQIIGARFYDDSEASNPLMEKAVKTFLALRKGMNADATTYRKAVSTSELIDWFEALKKCNENAEFNKLLQDDAAFHSWLNNAANNKQLAIPFGNVLFKTTASLFNFKTIDTPADFYETTAVNVPA